MWLIHPVVPPRSMWLVKLPEAPLFARGLSACQVPVCSLRALRSKSQCHGHWPRYRQRPTATETQDPTSFQDKSVSRWGLIAATPASQYLGAVGLVGEAAQVRVGVTYGAWRSWCLPACPSHKLAGLLVFGSQLRLASCQTSIALLSTARE